MFLARFTDRPASASSTADRLSDFRGGVEGGGGEGALTFRGGLGSGEGKTKGGALDAWLSLVGFK